LSFCGNVRFARPRTRTLYLKRISSRAYNLSFAGRPLAFGNVLSDVLFWSDTAALELPPPRLGHGWCSIGPARCCHRGEAPTDKLPAGVRQLSHSIGGGRHLGARLPRRPSCERGKSWPTLISRENDHDRRHSGGPITSSPGPVPGCRPRV
jgi:hypothetical protein